MIITNSQLRKVINEELQIVLLEQRLELFEVRLDRNISNLINEGVIDTIKAGYGKAKELAGAAKEKYDAAVEKLGEFYLDFGIQTWGLLQQAKGAFGAVGAALHSAAKKIQKFCNVHPILCAAGKCLLIISACAVVVAWSASSAEEKHR
jgi:ribosomal protein L29